MMEQVQVFGQASALVGMLHTPSEELRRPEAPAVILLNAGMVHRVGPNRLYVKLARALAAQGHIVLRFDFSGFGDSGVRRDHLPLEKCMVDETLEAMNLLSSRFGSCTFFLIGLCSGATASLRTAARDPRVMGAVLINARAGGDELRSYIMGRSALRKYSRVLARDRMQWIEAIRERMHVRRLANVLRALGRDLSGPLRGAGRSFPEAEQTASEMHAILGRGGRLLILCSEWDPGLDFMKVVRKDLDRRFGSGPGLQYATVAGADHTFTDAGAQSLVLGMVRDWASQGASGTSDLKLRNAG